MAPARDLRGLFLHELAEMLYAERKLVGVLDDLCDQTTDPELRDGFGRHLVQTRSHAENLEKAFEILGEEASAEQCLGIEGIVAEHQAQFGALAEELHDIFNVGAAARTEHYEIAAYEGLIPKGEALEANEVVALLWENLKDEKETLHELNTAAEKLATVRGPGSAMA